LLNHFTIMTDDAHSETTGRRPAGSRKIPRATGDAQRGSAMPAAPESTHEEIAKLAHQFWEERGAPIGSPEVDWARAEQALDAGAEGAAPDTREAKAGSAARQAEHNS
jgi:Protein of unknown function (DUF2934)